MEFRTAVAAAIAASALLAACSGSADGGGQGGDSRKASTENSTTKQREAKVARLNYVEFPVRDIKAAKTFYEAAFGWKLTDFAPTYAATLTGDTDIGLDADAAEATRAPLPVIEVADLEATLAEVEKAGGKVVRPIFAFPGGRRFHFLDPSGNEVAASQPD